MEMDMWMGVAVSAVLLVVGLAAGLCVQEYFMRNREHDLTAGRRQMEDTRLQLGYLRHSLVAAEDERDEAQRELAVLRRGTLDHV